MSSVTVFLSAVSGEFHERTPERFESYRNVLAIALRRLGTNFQVIVQEELTAGPGDLLETLDNEVAKSKIVVHLVGHAAGAEPQPAELRRLRERHEDLLAHEPELCESLVLVLHFFED